MRVLYLLGMFSGVLLAGCVTSTPPAPSQAEITRLVQDHLIVIKNSDFEPVVSKMKDKEIIFLGEAHGIKALNRTSGELAVALAAERPVVWAQESCYGSYLWMEAVSLGKQKDLNPWPGPEIIINFNSNRSPEKKILMTAIDIYHSIDTDKPGYIQYLQFLAGWSSCRTVTKTINEKIALLSEQDTFDKMDSYLKDLDRLFRRYSETFSSEDWEEIQFSMDLLRASCRYEYLTANEDWDKNAKRFWDIYSIRYRYFNKTIERAYEKARKRSGMLICLVGSWHVDLSHRCEAKYFKERYSLTKGKTASIRLIPLYSDKNKNRNKNVQEIDISVNNLMGNSDYGYLDLNELKKDAKQNLAWSNYFTHRGPKYDGLLFVRAEKKEK